jgi:hypothetical protein
MVKFKSDGTACPERREVNRTTQINTHNKQNKSLLECDFVTAESANNPASRASKEVTAKQKRSGTFQRCMTYLAEIDKGSDWNRA